MVEFDALPPSLSIYTTLPEPASSPGGYEQYARQIDYRRGDCRKVILVRKQQKSGHSAGPQCSMNVSIHIWRGARGCFSFEKIRTRCPGARFHQAHEESSLEWSLIPGRIYLSDTSALILLACTVVPGVVSPLHNHKQSAQVSDLVELIQMGTQRITTSQAR